VWLERGKTTLDWYDGRRYTLVRVGENAPAGSAFEDAFANRKVPFQQVQLTKPDAVKLYEKKLVLVRPDGHVCWRGDMPPQNVQQVVDSVRGA
jgi:hypothetical protein